MTKEELKKILENLELNICKIRNLTEDYDEIRVRMGKSLYSQLVYNFDNVILVPVDSANTIMGCPIEIEYYNNMCLEVHLVKKIPIYKDNKAAEKSSH